MYVLLDSVSKCCKCCNASVKCCMNRCIQSSLYDVRDVMAWIVRISHSKNDCVLRISKHCQSFCANIARHGTGYGSVFPGAWLDSAWWSAISGRNKVSTNSISDYTNKNKNTVLGWPSLDGVFARKGRCFLITAAFSV